MNMKKVIRWFGKEFCFYFRVKDVDNIGKDCWSQCRGNEGPCQYCGTGLCCRKGFSSSNECDGVRGIQGKHACVAHQGTSIPKNF